jgi:hypothetical protein
MWHGGQFRGNLPALLRHFAVFEKKQRPRTGSERMEVTEWWMPCFVRHWWIFYCARSYLLRGFTERRECGWRVWIPLILRIRILEFGRFHRFWVDYEIWFYWILKILKPASSQMIHPVRWSWPKPSTLRLSRSPTVPQHTQLSDSLNPPKRLVQWGKSDSPF